MKISLKKKLTLSIVAAIFVLGGLAIYFVFLYGRDTFLQNQKENLQKFSIEKANQVRQSFLAGQETVEIIAGQHYSPEYVSSPYGFYNPEKEHILRHLNAFNLQDKFLAIYLLDSEGNTLISTDESFVGKNYGFRDYFKVAIKGESFVDIAVGATSGELGYYFSAPIEGAEGNISGVAVVKMRPEAISDTMKNLYRDEGDYVMLVNQDGVVIFSNKEETIFKSLGALSQDEKNELEKGRFSGIKIGDLGYDMAQNDLGGIKDAKVFDFFDKEDDRGEILSLAEVRDFPFYIFIEQDADYYGKQALKISIYLSLFVLSAVLAAALIIYFLLNGFLRPLSRLKEKVDSMEVGYLDQNMDINTGDEIEELAESFDALGKKLKKSYAQIEKKVQERTERLAKINEKMVGREMKMIELKKEIKKLKEKNENKK